MLIIIIIDNTIFDLLFRKKNSKNAIDILKMNTEEIAVEESDWMTKSIFEKEMKSAK